MTRFYGFVGSAVGSYAGWWLGAPLGLMTAFVVGMVGTGAGFYFGRKIAQHYQP